MAKKPPSQVMTDVNTLLGYAAGNSDSYRAARLFIDGRVDLASPKVVVKFIEENLYEAKEYVKKAVSKAKVSVVEHVVQVVPEVSVVEHVVQVVPEVSVVEHVVQAVPDVSVVEHVVQAVPDVSVVEHVVQAVPEVSVVEHVVQVVPEVSVVEHVVQAVSDETPQNVPDVAVEPAPYAPETPSDTAKLDSTQRDEQMPRATHKESKNKTKDKAIRGVEAQLIHIRDSENKRKAVWLEPVFCDALDKVTEGKDKAKWLTDFLLNAGECNVASALRCAIVQELLTPI